MITYVHTNIIAKDWKKLSLFYQKVLGCKPLAPKRDLSGDWIERVTGIKGVHIEGEHLVLPGYLEEGPTLEIFSYNCNIENPNKKLNFEGFAHIAFEVDDVKKTLDVLIQEGGSVVGELITKEYEGIGLLTIVYTKDIEGNIIELQSWVK